jgi:hypothetical protein
MRACVAAFLPAFVCLSAHGAYAETQWLRDPARKIAFAYDDSRWLRVAPAESTTIFAVNWLAKKDKGLIASCYLATAPSSLANIVDGSVHQHKDQIVEALMANLRKRDPGAELVSAEASYADNHEAIHLVRRVAYKALDRSGHSTLEMLFTVWNKEEVVLECGYDDVLGQDQFVKEYVETHIKEVLRTLHFER